MLVADVDPRVRRALEALLEALPGVTVTATCATGSHARALAERLRPDAALVDLYLPTLAEGLAAAAGLTHYGCRVIAVCTDAAAESAARRAGAVAFIGKDRTAEVLPRLFAALPGAPAAATDLRHLP